MSNNNEIRTKRLELTKVRIKEDGEDPGGVIEGLAAAFGNIDRQREIIQNGAFRKFLKEFDQKKGIPFVDSHNVLGGTSAIIGRVNFLEESNAGLKFRAFFSTTADSQAVRQKFIDGTLDSFSIGFRIDKDRVRSDGVRVLEELTLFEVSAVGFPANPKATVSRVKSNGTAAITTQPEMHSMDRDRLYRERMKKLVAEAKARRAAEDQRAFELWEKQGCP